MLTLFAPVLSALGLALLFYVAIPLAGAFRMRARWREIRRRLDAARRAPTWSFDHGGVSDGLVGRFRIDGAIEAVQGLERLWARGSGYSIIVEPGREGVLTLPQGDSLAEPGDSASLLELADERVEPSPWSRLGALVEGTRILAWGEVFMEGGAPVLRGTAQAPALVLVHDGADEHAIPRALWSARHRNEYWNPATQLSLAAGVVAMSVLAGSSTLQAAPTFIIAAALTIAFAPALPLVPPGLLALLVYRRLWDAARRARARRDIARQQGRNDEAAARGRAATYLVSLACLAFATGFLVNAALAYAGIKVLLR